MQLEPFPSLFDHCIGTLASMSLMMWFYFGWRRRQPILPREPREPVPWNYAVPLLVTLLVLLQIGLKFAGEASPPQEEPAGVLELCNLILTGAAFQIALYGTMLAAAALLFGATQRDLGLPEFAHEFGRDLKIGALTWLAALLPVYAVQVILVSTGGKESGHPLIKMLQQDPSGPLMFVAFLSAVIVAPICEECAFRLLLQGWLEKFEDQSLGWQTQPSNAVAEDSPASADDQVDELVAEPPRRGLGGLPYGWAPILASSLIFALAHIGYGPDPVALFVLALMLGYVYQRTHRIVPCIVAHGLFNLTTLVILAISATRGVVGE
jgi:membrane protease YdiL (CAAX protease family)